MSNPVSRREFPDDDGDAVDVDDFHGAVRFDGVEFREDVEVFLSELRFAAGLQSGQGDTVPADEVPGVIDELVFPETAALVIREPRKDRLKRCIQWRSMRMVRASMAAEAVAPAATPWEAKARAMPTRMAVIPAAPTRPPGTYISSQNRPRPVTKRRRMVRSWVSIRDGGWIRFRLSGRSTV